jgi:hypothetical protein
MRMDEWRIERVDTETEDVKIIQGQLSWKRNCELQEHPLRHSAVPTEPDIFGIIRNFGTGDGEHRRGLASHLDTFLRTGSQANEQANKSTSPND